jgi:hypothetical protein
MSRLHRRILGRGTYVKIKNILQSEMIFFENQIKLSCSIYEKLAPLCHKIRKIREVIVNIM